MKLLAKIVIRIKRGFLPYFTNETYKRGCEIHKLSLLSAENGNDIFLLEIVYFNRNKFKGFLDKISKDEVNFQIISVKKVLEDEIRGGLLTVSGKTGLEDFNDYELHVLGASGLIIDKMDEDDDKIKYSGISKNVAIICGVDSRKNYINDLIKIHLSSEGDAVLINKFSGLNAFPIIIKFSFLEEFIKTLQGIESTFSAIRITYIKDIDELFMYESIFPEISIPMITQSYDEIPLYLLISIFHVLAKNKIELKDNNIGLVGINVSALRITRLMIKLGCSRILGYDNKEKLMLSFEKEGGLATTQENIFNNSDIVIIFKEHFSIEDIQRAGPGQIIISLINSDLGLDVIQERGIKEFLHLELIELSSLFPGILRGIIENDQKYLSDTKIIDLAKKIFNMNSSQIEADNRILPALFSDIHNRIPGFFDD